VFISLGSSATKHTPNNLLLGYDSNTRAYKVFNLSTGLVEVSCDIVFDRTNGSQVEQVDLDELDDEEAPCVALRNMSIGICVQKNLKSLHKHKINHHLPYKHLHQLKMRTWLKRMMIKIKTMSLLKWRTLIKGEMKTIKTREMIKRFRIKDRHTPESTKQFKEITPSTPYLVTFTRGIEDALRDPDWVVAMQEELNNFTRNEVWHLVPRPNLNVVGTKWVFCNKQDEHGVVTRNKARLVTKGYSQVEGLDFDETYCGG
jgi:hypothetical protein